MQNDEYQGQQNPGMFEQPEPTRELTYKKAAPASQAPAPQRAPRKVRQPVYEEDDYDYEDEEDDDDAARRAGKGCLFAFLGLLAVILIALGIAFFWYRGEIAGKHASATGPQVVEIVEGATAKSIGKTLQEAGLIGNGTVFRYYVSWIYDGDVQFQAGSFEIEAGTGYEEILYILQQPPNRIVTVDVRIPEGYTIMAVANLLEEAGVVDSAEEFLMVADDLERFSDIEFISRVQADLDTDLVFHASEGLIFPDTYNLEVGVSTEDTVRRLYLEMDAKITPEMYERMDELDITVREFLTLASIVQAEAGHEEQQPYVSDVLWNRLGPGWSQNTLGVDVTIKYVRQYMQWTDDEWAQVPRNDILYADARDYVGEERFYAYVTEDSDAKSRQGLPAGPICSVSASAMQAALYPEAKDGETYYYFLTTLKGNYYYARTYQEHQANIQIMYRENAEFEEEQGAGEETGG